LVPASACRVHAAVGQRARTWGEPALNALARGGNTGPAVARKVLQVTIMIATEGTGAAR
jgi:hypothetical protein